MNAYKKDFENAVEMIDWQNKMLRQQADRIAELEKYVEAWIFLNNGMIELASNGRKILKENQNDYTE